METYTEEWIERYSRHIILPEIGGVGQEKLGEAKVLLLGAGGLGSPIALYLAAAGIGNIAIVDYDNVDLSNLQRQVIHKTSDIGRPKVESAVEAMRALNPGIEVIGHNTRIDSTNIMQLMEGYDLVIDGSDNFPTRFLANDACVIANKPLVHGAILRFDGQLMTIKSDEGPCYRCIFREPPPPGAVPSCQQAGILGAIAGIIGTLQASEAVKLILGIGEPLIGRMAVIDTLHMNFRTVKVKKDPSCPVCGEEPIIKSLIDYEEACEILAAKAQSH